MSAIWGAKVKLAFLYLWVPHSSVPAFLKCQEHGNAGVLELETISAKVVFEYTYVLIHKIVVLTADNFVYGITVHNTYTVNIFVHGPNCFTQYAITICVHGNNYNMLQVFLFMDYNMYSMYTLRYAFFRALS